MRSQHGPSPTMQSDTPSEAQVDETHREYVASLVKVFEDYKHAAGCGLQTLVVR